jgi:hypothetical protein
MTREDFVKHINRLSETFGKSHYAAERVRMLWQQVSDFDAVWLERVVDGMISSMRQAPLPSDFSEGISIERERLWKRQKDENASDAKAFWATSFMTDDVRWICQTIIKRMDFNRELGQAERSNQDPSRAEELRAKRAAGDAQWTMFLGALNNVAEKRI